MESLRVGFAVEIAVFFAPVRPAAGQAIKDLSRIPLGSGDRFTTFADLRITVVIDLRNARLAKVLLDQNVDRHLRPRFWDFDPIHGKDHAAIGVSDLGGSLDESNAIVGVVPGACKATRDLHVVPGVNFPCDTRFGAPVRGINSTDLHHYIWGSRGLSTLHLGVLGAFFGGRK